METIYPDDEEIKFRKKHYCVLEDILNDKIECTICNSDLLNEIISKRMIMVHKSHLFLCCCNCFFKLCEGNEYGCILCKSNNELSNCRKCNLNICSRCVENHNFTVSNGVLKKCFHCKPNMLWKQRALAANVLKIFSSQLDMPNGLLVNEIDREQTVRKYLVAEAKIGQNSITKNIKDHISLDFILNSYKMTINTKLSEYSPKLDVTQMDENLDEFIKMCEHVLEKTCSTLTNFKRIFNLNSLLSPGVSAIIKSLLKSAEEEEIVISSSKINGHFEKTMINNEAEQLLDKGNTRILRSANKPTVDGDVLNKEVNSLISDELSSAEKISTKITVDKQSNDSVSPHRNVDKLSNNIDSVVEQDEIIHPLDLFNEISSDEDKNIRQLRSRKSIKYNEEEKTKKVKKKTKDEKLDVVSDDEKEIDRLIKLSNVEKVFKKKICTNEDEIIGVNVIENTSSKLNPKSSKKEEEKMELINQAIENIDEPESGSDVDNFQDEEYPLKMVKDIFNEITNATSIPVIDHEPDSDASDDSSIFDVINACLTACHKPGIDHYRNKIQGNHSNLNDMDSIDGSDENYTTENEETSEKSELSNEDKTSTESCSRRVSPFKMQTISDDDSDFGYKIKKFTKGTKRKITSSSDSDSSSKFFKKSPKKQIKISKNSFFELSNSSDSSNSSSYISPVLIKTRRKRIKKLNLNESDEVKSSSTDDDSDNVPNSQKNGRKNIRKLKKKTELSQLTKDAIKEEDLRRKRMEERQKLYNEIYDMPKEMESCKKLVLDFDPVTKEELVSVHPDIVKFLKPHQVEGIKFLWDSVFESVETIKKGHKGNGSIVAHCMGLGKTLQVITLIHTLFRYPELGIKTVLVVTPHATIENWCKEFNKWLSDIHEDKNFYILSLTESKTYDGRNKLIEEWRREHGVLVTSYQLYRTVVNYRKIKKFPAITEGLIDPGPDLVICDEGHVLKNHESKQSKALSRMKTLRRIVLTGTPLQNNLKEYHCMVDFIRPNLLGSIKDFTNRFINPITNGQYSDSTPLDVRLMKRRSHVLHRMLKGFVQRFDYSVLTPFLPPKHEYVIYLKMSDKQIELYQHYLDNYRQTDLFTNYHILQMIWTHPKLLVFYDKRTELKREKQKFKDIEASFVNDETSNSNSDSTKDIENEQNLGLEPSKAKIPEMDLNWWKPLVSKTDLETVYPYSKFIMMFSILKECEEIGDKVLLFSQSLFTLDLIQDFLENAEDLENDKGGPYGKSWTQGEDFFRIDGSVTLKVREECCSKFNDVKNTKMRLLLLSTKAFNLGINLVGANRVIIFDVTWNPSLNVQSIFRVFRFGQIKPCYIYRLVSEGTMEQKVYERQISKLSMAFRVVDEHQIDRHYNAQDHLLYEFEPNTSEPKSTLNLPKDRLMAELILKHKDLVMDILEHDSLLQNNEEEELDESDRNAAWEDYQREREGLNNIQNNLPTNNQFNPITNNHSPYTSFQRTPYDEDITLFNTLSSLFPQATLFQLNDMISQVKQAQNVEQ